MPTANLNTELETFVTAGLPNSSWFATKQLCVGEFDPPYQDYARSWLRFNLSSIPTIATIVSASLTTYPIWMIGNAGYFTFVLTITRSTDITWTSGLTWNTAPSVGTAVSIFDMADVDYSGGFNPIVFDGLGSTVQSALATGKLSLRIAADVPDGATGQIIFTNSGYPGVDPAVITRLDVTYTVPSAGRPGIRTSGLMNNSGLLIGGGM